MTEQTNPEEDLSAGFRALGENLTGMLRAAWDRPERQKLQHEIENGLHELGNSLKQASDELSHEFSQSGVGQRVKSGVDDFRTRLRTGEVEKTVRSDLSSALQTINDELTKLTAKMQAAVDSESHASERGKGGEAEDASS